MAEEPAIAESGTRSKNPTEEIRKRIEALHQRQADYHRRATAGEIEQDKELQAKWPELQKQTLQLREAISSLNALDLDSAARPAVEAKIFEALQPLGIHLDAATHPNFEPRILDTDDIAEMDRIEKAIAGMKFGDRTKAFPTTIVGPSPIFTLIHLPTPLVIQSQPNDTLYLASTTGGAFENGLSLIELRADEQGIARTTWMSIGDAVADCALTIYSVAAIEPRHFEIKVVTPMLTVPEGFPEPKAIEAVAPRVKSKAVLTEGKAESLTE